MMNRTKLAAMLIPLSLGVCAPAWSGEVARTSGEALKHSAQAVGYSLAASVQVVSGVIAIPLGLSAEVGKVSGEMSDSLWEIANTPIGEPLPVADEAITLGPSPREALDEDSQ